ncbi:MAG: hypothetical protein D6720_12745 [Gammaproteobacteria bacterium]|nr:MAG: hypothetical protein D6720_12745 [Gammaproteobacteria bacterium]
MDAPALRQATALLDLEPAGQSHAAVLPLLEQRLWDDPSVELQNLYAAFCREMGQETVAPHPILVVIPVADRPRQLRQCLESLLGARGRFAYPGGLRLLLVEDSAREASREANRALIDEMNHRGLDSHYLGLSEQWGLLQRWQSELPLFLGEHSPDGLGHKGASVTRNIAKLWLAHQGFEDTLFHFIDSDQAFHLGEANGDPLFLLDHAGHIDRMFRVHGLEVLTGKVIGDPPVSPAVMAGTLLQDLLSVLDRALPALDRPCCFHQGGGDAGHGAYHDMAGLFGLQTKGDFVYACPLPMPHNHDDMLEHLGSQLGRFFDGEHPTRVTRFTPTPIEQSLAPARTVYTGNYVLNHAGLRHGIPFANLKLRMAGPTLGRLLQARLGPAFAQANLPLLHRRTESGSGRAECRPGVVRHHGGIDLSDEYRRQFLGDWMLFTVVELVESDYPSQVPEERRIAKVLSAVEGQLLREYRRVRRKVGERLHGMEQAMASSMPGTIRHHFLAFAATVRANYQEDTPAVRALEDPGFRDLWRQRLLESLRALPGQQQAWERRIAGQ